MRHDMHQVIVERPRAGLRLRRPKGGRRAARRCRPEDFPRRESISKAWSRAGTKWQTDLLGPLQRFLRSRIGRPWDKIYSEICEHADRRSLMQRHLLTHVEGEVETRALVLDGRTCTTYGLPLRPGELYVCPRTGLLREVPHRRRA
jgi:hypothetical protein